MYAIERYILFRNIDILLICKSFLFGHTIIGNGWYLQVQLLFYFAFFVIFYRTVSKDTAGIMLLCTLLYMLACHHFGLSATWYATSILFPLGVLFGLTSDIIRINGRKSWALITLIALLICLATYYAQSRIDNPSVKVILLSLSTVHFVFFAIFSLQVVPIQHRITAWLGSISLEIYVLQGLYLNLFKSEIAGISNPYIYIALVSCCTIATAAITHPFFSAVFSLGNKLAKK